MQPAIVESDVIICPAHKGEIIIAVKLIRTNIEFISAEINSNNLVLKNAT